MSLPQEKYYTAEEFYAMTEDIRAELVNGEIIYMAAPGRLHQELSRELLFAITGYKKTYSFHDTIKAGIYEDLMIDFSGFDLGDSI